MLRWQTRQGKKNCTYAGQPLTGKDSKLFETADAAKMDKVTIL